MRYFSFLFLIVFASIVNAELIKSSMNCVLKEQIILSNEDSRVQKYNSYSGNIEKGDSLKLIYEFDTINNKLVISMDDGVIGSKDFKRRYFGFRSLTYNPKFEMYDFNGSIYFDIAGAGAYIGKNEFGHDYAVFKRYYKDDWIGMTSSVGSVMNKSEIQGDIQTWDCKHSGSSKINEIVDLIIKYGK